MFAKGKKDYRKLPAIWAWVKGWAYGLVWMLGGLAGFVDLEERLKTLAGMEGGWQGDRLTRLVGDRWAERWRLEDDGSAHIVNSAWATSSSSSSSSLLLQPPGTPKPGWNKTPSPNVTPSSTHTAPRTCLKAVNTVFGLETRQRDSDVQQTWHSGRKWGINS